MRRLVLFAAAALWWAVVASAAFAYPERVEEVWRSEYGNDRTRGCDHALAPSPSDGSFWLIEGATVAHYDAGGTLLTRSQALCTPWVLATDPVNGSCWVLQATKDELAHLGADGTLLSATPGPSRNATLLPSPADGSVWVSDSGRVTHVDALGAQVWTISAQAQALAVDPGDGSVWLLEGSTLVRRAADGSELWRVTGFGADLHLGEDPRNQSVWAGDETGRLAHLSAAGELLWETSNGGSRPILDLQVLPADGSLWVNYWWNLDHPDSEDPADRAYVARLDASGVDLFHRGTWLVSVNLHDGSAWILGPWAVILYSADGDYVDGISSDVWWYAFDPVDSGYWATEVPDQTPSLSRYQADGTLLWTQQRPWLGVFLEVDPSDGSCWTYRVYDYWTVVLIHVSPEGEELEQGPVPAGQQVAFLSPLRFSATDHTWWASDGSALVHLAADGTELWRQPGVFAGALLGFEISPLDGSLWLTSSASGWSDTHSDIPPNSHLVHLAADGTLLSAADYDTYFRGLALTADGGFWTVSVDEARTAKLLRFSRTGEVVGEVPVPPGLSAIFDLQVNPSDGSIYGVGRSTDHPSTPADVVFRMAADGTILWQVAGFYDVSAALVPEDGSLWLADRGRPVDNIAAALYLDSRVGHLDANGQYLWQSAAFNGPEHLQINGYDGTPWLLDTGNRQVVHLQAIPSPFADILGDSWAFDAIAACVAAGVVQGYWDNTYRPDLPVTRGQMAVYISRALAGGDEGVQVASGLAEPTFNDVDEEYWAYRYVEYCAGANIAEGYPNGSYHPDEVVNRGQMAVYIARALVTPSGDVAVPDPPAEPTFPDVTAENDWSWCYPHVEYCAAEGVVQGYWDGTYRPAQAVTRDQMAVYVARAFGLPM